MAPLTPPTVDAASEGASLVIFRRIVTYGVVRSTCHVTAFPRSRFPTLIYSRCHAQLRREQLLRLVTDPTERPENACCKERDDSQRVGEELL